MKKKPSVAWSTVKQELLKNKNFSVAVKELEPEFEIVRQSCQQPPA